MQHHLRVRIGALVLLTGCATLGGCSTVKPSTAYLNNLQQIAMHRGFASGARSDVYGECPSCSVGEAAFAQNIIDAELNYARGCGGVADAEANYQRVRAMMDPSNSTPAYQAFVSDRVCRIADRYQKCATSPERSIAAGDRNNPAGALTAAIDQCRMTNPAQADEILDRAIADKEDAINRALLSDDYATAARELRVYAALPRANQQRAEQWRSTIENEESADHATRKRIAGRVRSMVCDEHYDVRNPETGYAKTVSGLNMRNGGKIVPENPYQPVSRADTPETRMTMLAWELSNLEDMPSGDAREMLQRAYDRAHRDSSYCSLRQ